MSYGIKRLKRRQALSKRHTIKYSMRSKTGCRPKKDAELAALDERIAMLRAETNAENEAAKLQDYEESLAEKAA